MPTILDIRNESLAYSATFARPPLELWGAGGRIIKGLCEALEPYNISLRNIHVSPAAATAADAVIAVQIGSTVLKFSFEKVEATFSGFGEDEFRGIPKFLQMSTGWLEKQYPFAAHEAWYFCHAFLKGPTVDEFLKNIYPNPIKSAGLDLGSGGVFYRAVPEKAWTIQLTIDKSQQFPGGLFIGLRLNVATGLVDYNLLFTDGRQYLAKALTDLGLALPELAG
ncbi:MAG: hypothetical protein ACRD5K_11600 [Candidatus Acidiferrales bacterium]